MEQNVPRRLQRFYRGGENKAAEEPRRANYYDQPFQNLEQDETESPTGREILKKIPSTNYEDVPIDSTNAEDIKKIEQRNLESKLALEEIEKFKKENKRLPTKEEADQIAESLYSQFKNTDTSPLYEGITPKNVLGQVESKPKHGRHGREEQKTPIAGNEQQKGNKIPSLQDEQKTSSPTGIEDLNLKSMLGKNASEKPKKSEEDEFDLGLDEASGESNASNESEPEEESIEDMSFEEGENCPNCKKTAEKTLYCSKCGAAFCANCAATQGNNLLCPKCGSKIKI
jgi:DNA-directed RNA polymerase subunit RPC12/RpoP